MKSLVSILDRSWTCCETKYKNFNRNETEAKATFTLHVVGIIIRWNVETGNAKNRENQNAKVNKEQKEETQFKPVADVIKLFLEEFWKIYITP